MGQLGVQHPLFYYICPDRDLSKGREYNDSSFRVLIRLIRNGTFILLDFFLFTKTPVIVLLFAVIFGAAQILNMPVLIMYRFGIYAAAFLIGYYVFSHDEVQEKIERIGVPMLCLAVIGTVLYTFHYFGSDYTSPECLQSVTTNLYLWIVVLAVMGCAKKYGNRETAFTRYMTKASFGIYILHYPVLIVTCYLLQYCFQFLVICNYLIALVMEFILTFALYEVVRRIPVVRYVVLGIKNK